MEEHASNRWTDYSLVCIIRRIVKEIPTVIAAGLIAAMLTVAYLQVFYKPQYTAGTTVAVGMKNASYTSVFSNLSSTSEMAGTFTKLFDSTMFSTISKEKLGVEKLNGELEAFVVPQTNLMTMRVTADNPTDAFKTLRFLLDNYSAVSDYVFQNVVLRELDPPSVPKSPSNPLQLRAAIERAFIIGAAAMAAAALVYLEGGNPQQCADAAAFALMNLLGLVCDPVGGLVEVPCVYRNVGASGIAFTAADMALSGIRCPIEPDEVILAMKEVGDALPTSLRETGEGGCAACESICKRLHHKE